MDRIREQFSRKSEVRRDASSDEAAKASETAQPSPEQSSQTQSIAEDEELYGLKELWPDELRGYDTAIEWVRHSVFKCSLGFLTSPNQYHRYPWP